MLSRRSKVVGKAMKMLRKSHSLGSIMIRLRIIMQIVYELEYVKQNETTKPRLCVILVTFIKQKIVI